MAPGLLSPTHIAIVLVLVLLIFGAKRLPETGRALGRGMREFKEAVAGRGEHATGSQPPSLTAHVDGHEGTTNIPRD